MAASDIKLSAEFGTAPVGAEVEEWEWAEDEDGYRFESHYMIIPPEAITVRLDWHGITPDCFVDLCETYGADPTVVVRYTIVHDASKSFIASTWVRVSEALADITAFLEAHK